MDGRALMDRKVVGIVFFGVVAVVTSTTTAGHSVVQRSCSCSCSCSCEWTWFLFVVVGVVIVLLQLSSLFQAWSYS